MKNRSTPDLGTPAVAGPASLTLTIDGKPVRVTPGTSVLRAAALAGSVGESGKVLTLTYAKDGSDDKFNDCVYVRNFTAGKATVVTFHANDNSKTVFIATDDMYRFISNLGYEYKIIDL